MLNVFDFILPPIYLVVIFFCADLVRKANIKDKPYYKYFTLALFAKILGGICVCLVYTFYYKGGDTHYYFYYGGEIFKRLFLENPMSYFKALIDSPSPEALFLFNSRTGYPMYWHDPNTLFVSKLISFISFFSFSSFIVAAILLATLCFSGVWRLYQTFIDIFPSLYKELAVSILFIPSVVFWGSGILKDTITLSALGWYVYAFYFGIIKREDTVKRMFFLLISSYLLLSIKPYILFALIPGSLIWYLTTTIFKIKNFFIKAVVTPFLTVLILGGAYALLLSLGDELGLYRVDTVMERAVIVQKDLKQDYYKGNSFDIGDFDASFESMASKAPAAINAALFRPYIIEAKNPVMLLAGLENAYFLWITLFLLWKVKFYAIFAWIKKTPMLTFSILFSLFFAFAVGISTSNFGSLVRYKIPLIPFYVSSLFIIMDNYKKSIRIDEPKLE